MFGWIFTSISHQAISESTAFDISGTQIQGTMIQNQENVSVSQQVFYILMFQY